MTDEWTMPDTWLVIYEHGTTNVTYGCASETNRIDAALSAWLESGKTRDELLSVRMIEGEEYRIPLSSIRSFFLSTPDFRERSTAALRYQRDETRENRAKFGLPYKEDDD